MGESELSWRYPIPPGACTSCMHLGRGAAHDSYCSPSLGLVDVAPPSRGSNNLLYIYPGAVYKSRPGLPVKRSRNVALSDQVFF